MANYKHFCHRVSKLFQPINIVPVGARVKNNSLLSKSYKLMVDQGVIAPTRNGFVYLLPLAVKALDKLIRLADRSMADVGAQKISCPTFTSSDIWEDTGRLSAAGAELFHVTDRHNKDFILSPTHEESVTHLLGSLPTMSYKQLPLLLYQITNKFRDEMKPRFGLIRTKEFLMQDLYSFDNSEQAAQETYKLISQTYQTFLETIGVDFLKVKGCPGTIGGEVSHEYHYMSDIGDDSLRLCSGCGYGWNKNTNEASPCTQCGGSDISETKSIEVGHMFLLNCRYSTPLHAHFTSQCGGKEPLVMASYGLGLTRILAASLEVLSLPDQLRWPPLLAPYKLLIITPKVTVDNKLVLRYMHRVFVEENSNCGNSLAHTHIYIYTHTRRVLEEGSKESSIVQDAAEKLYWSLQSVPGLTDEVIWDDRNQLTIGRRLHAARRTGYPLVAVLGKAHPQVELHNMLTGQMDLYSTADLLATMAAHTQQYRSTVTQ